ncbi:MAG: ribonuclease PH [Candidatus Omnitrophica bacterium]|nr:ribonuclease PH [Candidatus Omnitrophota bacterium]
MSKNPMRRKNQLRKIKIETGYLKNALGSCLIHFGDTSVLCTMSVEDKVPPFLKGTGSGWLTAEYGMIPASCNKRIPRDSSRGKINGRSQEIQRLIGRSLRAAVDLTKLGEKTIWIDCDVIQGDGGTRTASITGAFVALCQGVHTMLKDGRLTENPIVDAVAAISVGIVNGTVQLDLSYEQDSAADVDMNVVMTGSGGIIEVQGTAEKKAFSEKEMNEMIVLAKKGIKELNKLQKQALPGFSMRRRS